MQNANLATNPNGSIAKQYNFSKLALALGFSSMLLLSACQSNKSEEEVSKQEEKAAKEQAILLRINNSESQKTPSNADSLRLRQGSQLMGAFAMDMSMVVNEPAPYHNYTNIQHEDDFEHFNTNPIFAVEDNPVSTFSADVDTASYSFVRRQLNEGYLPDKSAVRLEEMLNYFNYRYPGPKSIDEPFLASTYVHDSPWAPARKLIHIGIQGFDGKEDSTNDIEQADSNIVFLLDVSGSMSSADKLPLVKKSMKLLLNQLKPTDMVSIVVYAGAAGEVLSPTQVKDKRKIIAAFDNLSAGGSTAGGEGLKLAYQLAQDSFVKDGVNRIILATDGDFNLGISDRESLKAFVERKRDKGIYLSVLGFGQGNYHDHLMQTLAQNGNGIAAYIDTLSEAQKVLVQEATSSLFPIATDLKIQVEFNPALVKEYRLLGYETRALNKEDFNNDRVDAGDIGAGHSVTAIYEITLQDSEFSFLEPLRYQQSTNTTRQSNIDLSNELAFLKMRYKPIGKSESILIEQAINSQNTNNQILAEEAKFAASVAGFAQLLKDKKYLSDWNEDDAIALALNNRGNDVYGYRSEFVQLMRKTKSAQVLR